MPQTVITLSVRLCVIGTSTFFLIKTRNPMKNDNKTGREWLLSLAAGLTGATVVTLLHGSARRINPETAPRMDVLGMRAIAKTMEAAGTQPPPKDELFAWTLAGDLVGNAIYYSLTGTGKGVWLRGSMLGLAAGLGGVVLPGPLGLGEAPSNRTPQTQAMTVAWYLAGGLAAAAASQLFKKSFLK
jgi:hypothetical protein